MRANTKAILFFFCLTILFLIKTSSPKVHADEIDDLKRFNEYFKTKEILGKLDSIKSTLKKLKRRQSMEGMGRTGANYGKALAKSAITRAMVEKALKDNAENRKIDPDWPKLDIKLSKGTFLTFSDLNQIMRANMVHPVKVNGYWRIKEAELREAEQELYTSYKEWENGKQLEYEGEITPPQSGTTYTEHRSMSTNNSLYEEGNKIRLSNQSDASFALYKDKALDNITIGVPPFYVPLLTK